MPTARNRNSACKSCLVLFLALFSDTPCLRTAEWQDVFDPYQVLTLHLQMDSNDWERVRLDQPIQNESWVLEVAEALFWAEGETPIRATVRRKGQSDTPLPEGNPQKVSLKIDLNELVVGQKWRGLTKLSLENGSENPLTEGFAWIAHRLAWEAGIYGYEAAYSGWVRLFVNGELKGVFAHVEQRNAQFLRNHGYDKETATWLYKVDGSSSLEVGIGSSPAYRHLCFAPFNSGPGGGGGGGGGCTQPNLEADLPQWINLRGFFTLGAVDAFLENRDALFSHSGKNSYAVDFDPPYPRTRLYFPWDLDTTISDGNGSIYGNEPYQTQLLMHPWFRQVYEQLLRDLLDGPFSAAALHTVIDRIQTNISWAFDEDPYVYQSGSAEAFDDLHNWVDRRVPNVRAQLTHPWIARPVFNQDGGEVVPGFELTMSAPAGSVYYTVDGSDPRAPGGGISPSARLYSTPLVIDHTTHVIARAFDGTLWSALPNNATFNIARYASALRITEMMYHPRSAPDEDEYEFLELKNTGGATLNLSGFYFEGIDFIFPYGTVVPAGGFVVLARNPFAFSSRYPAVEVHGLYWGKLSDSGEKIRLRNSEGTTVISVEYDDDPPWSVAADGLGYSLVLAQPTGNPDDPETWRASSQLHGSPGADDPLPSYGLGVVINEVLAHTDPPLEDAIELHNTSLTPIDIGGWYLSDDFARTNVSGSYSLKKFRIPPGTTIPAGGFAVFYERDFRMLNAAEPFALTEYGESVYLSSADGNGNLTGFIVGAEFGASENGVSIGRHRTSRGVDFVRLSRTTFGADTPTTLEEFRSGTGAANAPPRVGPIVLNEIMYNPTGSGSEFLELLNITDAPVDLSGWTIGGTSFTFPTGTILEGHGLLLLLKTNTMSVATFRTAYDVPGSIPIFAHDFVLENEGEALRLERPNTPPDAPTIHIERVRYNDKSPWPTEADGEGPSLERFSATDYGNDPINWRTVADGGSPGRANQFALGVAIARQSAWKYHDAGSNLGAVWRGDGYSDSSWPDGDGPLGYGAAGLGTVVSYGPDPAQKPATVYFRKEFVINDRTESIANLRFDALYDDGFVVYLNGTEILRSSAMPAGSVAYDTLASSSYNSVGYESFDLSPHLPLLRRGENVLGVEVHQVSRSSDDLVWDASLTYDVTTQPTVATPVLTPGSGAFSGPIQVTIQCATPGAEIYYTVNGTDPDPSSFPYAAPISVDSSRRIRARAYKAGYNESAVATADYVIGSAPPPFLSVVTSASGEVNVTLHGQFNENYVIEASTDLSSWTAVLTNAASGSGAFTFSVPVVGEPPTRFFRGRRQ